MTRETVPVQPPPHPPGAGARRGETAGLVLLLAVAAWFYGWTATTAGSPLTHGLAPDDLYNRLADGFLAGRTSFAEEPPAELAALADPYDPAQNAPYKKYHDVTYYRGRYYLYFGPVPALVLLAPWKLLTGSYLPQNVATAAFAWGAALMAVLLVREVRRRWFPATGAGLVLALGAAAVFGTLLPMLLRRPLYYELAIASACFLGLLALWMLLKARVDEAPPRLGWLAGAGLCLGLTVGARPNYLFGSGAVVAFCLWLWWRQAAPIVPVERLRRLARPAGALLLPFIACGLALAAYNLARFGSLTEFGTSYMLAGGNQSGVSQTSLRYVPINLYYYLAAPPQFSAYFPFVQVIGFAPFAPPAGYSGQENTYGLAFALPVLWAIGLVWTALRRDLPARPWQAWARLVTVFAAGNAGFLLLLMGAANRYMVDFVPPLMVLALLGVMHGEATLAGWRRWLLRAGWGAALAVTLVFNVFVSLQHNELLAYHNPAAYRKLAHAANRWSQLWPAGESGPLRIDLTLPKNRTGKLEPLVVTGLSFRADFLYLFYKDDTHIQIGFEHTSYGGPMSPPLEVDYDVPHVLEVQMGSLYPPVEHPAYDGKSPEEINRLKRTLLIKLDGRVVHSGQYDFYDSSPGDVSVGRNPVSEAFGRRFTGVVRSVTRPAAIE
ncbi:unnamed protein product [Phaeothamnion confervicola]